MIHKIPIPTSPASNKQSTLDMAQELQKKNKKNQDGLDQVTVDTDHDSESDNQNDNFGLGIPLRNSPRKSNFEETGDPSVNINISNTDTNTNSSFPSSKSILRRLRLDHQCFSN